MPGIGTSKATNTATTTLDASTQAALDDYRRRAGAKYQSYQNMPPPNLEGVEAFFNPFQSQVIDATRGDFAHQRGVAAQAADDDVVKAGAFGGDRAGVYRAVAESGINRDEASTVAGLRSGGWQDAVAQLFAERSRRDAGSDAALGRLGYGLNFGGRNVAERSTRTPSFLDRLSQLWGGGGS